MCTVTLKAREPRDDERQQAFVIVTIGENEYKTSVGGVPAALEIDEDVQSYLNEHIDEYRLMVLHKLYPGYDLSETEGETELAKMLAWITAGCINPDETVIEMKAWGITHPAWVELDADIDALDVSADAKAVMKKLAKK